MKTDDSEKYSYITPQEISEVAHLIKVSAGDSTQPYKLRRFDPRITEADRLQDCEPLAKNDLFKYRTVRQYLDFLLTYEYTYSYI